MDGHRNGWRTTGARRLLAGLAAASLLIAGPAGPVTRAEAVTSGPPTTQVQAAADRSAGYMQRSVGADGRFVYEIDTASGAASSSYDIVRHAGSLWAMCDYYQTHPSAGLKASIERAAGYLQRRIRRIPNRTELAIVSLPEDDGQPTKAMLGATGLGLVALTSAERVRPGLTPKSTLRSLGRFLVYMQRTDGSFYMQYIPSRGRVGSPTSLYCPAESALGLLMLYELDPSTTWARSATNGLAYLARSRAGQAEIPVDHWAIIATAKLKQLYPKIRSQVQVPTSLLTDHASRITVAILDSQRDGGSFSLSGDTLVAATRLEGLQAALSALSAGHALRPRILAAVDKGTTFLIGTQVVEGRYAGAFPVAPGSTTVRIDHVQHALSAMLGYVRSNPTPLDPIVLDVSGSSGATLSVVWTGDTLLGDAAQGSIDRYGYGWPLQRVRGLLGADVTIVNHEAPITTIETPYVVKQYNYASRPAAAAALGQAGVSVLGLSNNHAMDRGPNGLSDTVRHAATAGLSTFGAGADQRQAERPLLIRGRDVTLGVVALSEGYGAAVTAGPGHAGTVPLSADSIRRGYALAKAAGADHVVAFVHWGENYAPVDAQQRQAAAMLAEAGYDLVIGHHSHTAQPAEKIGSTWVFYSLGNFVFGTPGRYSAGSPGHGIVLRTEFDAEGLGRVKADCISVDNDVVAFQPRPTPSAEAAAALHGLGISAAVDALTRDR